MANPTPLLIFLLWAAHLSPISPFSVLPRHPPLDPKESFTNTIASFGYTLEEHHLLTKDDRVFTVHRVVPDHPPPPNTPPPIPVVILNGILSHSAVYYLDTPFLQGNRSFCGTHLGFCLSLTGRYDLWILNSDDESTSLSANSIGNARFFEISQSERFWVSSLKTFSKPDVGAFISLIQSVTGSRAVAFLGYSQASDSMFAVASILPKFEHLLAPFVAASRARYIGRSTREFATIAPLFNMIPRLYIPADVLATYLRQPDGTPKKGNKVCAVLVVEPLGVKQEARDSRFDYGDTNWHLKSEAGGRKEVAFHLVLLYGDSDWVDLLTKLENLIDMLHSAGDYLVEHGCFKTRDMLTGK